MDGLTLLLLLAAAVGYAVLQHRVTALSRQVDRLDRIVARLASGTAPAEAGPGPDAEPRTVVAAPPSPEAPPPPKRRQPGPRVAWESLIGGRLPIWIGGAALVLAGVFLVRYSIEAGLLGPAARTWLAALFALALVAASEAARRLPPLRGDPRVGQALAGAGVASAYATLYLAATLYALLAPLPAFAVMLAITAAALALALRHGPPTAAMALAGGFAAPLVAGYDTAGIGPLLVYLAAFVAALFFLAARRGWGWLALVAAALGFGWANLILATAAPGDATSLAAFVVLLAVGASVALPATGTQGRWLRIAPLVAGFAQLVAIGPALSFDAWIWGFYLTLAVATLALAMREPILLPAAGAALALLLLLEALALLRPETDATPAAALVATLIFAIPGHLLARRAPGWCWMAIAGTAGPLLVAHACAPGLLAPQTWAVAGASAAAALAWLAHRIRAGGEDALVGASAAAALLLAVAAADVTPAAWLAVPLATLVVGLALWAHVAPAKGLFLLPALPFVAALLAAALPLTDYGTAIATSLAGDRLPLRHLPSLADALRTLALPTIAAAAALADPRQFGRARRRVADATLLVATLLAYTAGKQLLAIATPEAFGAWGFVERAAFTQACLALGFVLRTRSPAPRLADFFLTLGLLRYAWFDLALLNPVLEPQQVGSLPLLNAAVLHSALVAMWLWLLPAARATRPLAALATLVAAAASVRQAAHGNWLTGGITVAENGGYSAALLAVALAWLVRGIQTGARDLRLFGLLLLTLVTLKVFLVDAAALDGVLRILSFLGLGLALIAIGWAYSRFLGRTDTPA